MATDFGVVFDHRPMTDPQIIAMRPSVLAL